MKFQDDISNMNTYIHTYIRTSRNQYVPHFFKVGGINRSPSPQIGVLDCKSGVRFKIKICLFGVTDQLTCFGTFFLFYSVCLAF